MKPFDPSILEPGDTLLYRPASIFGWAIAVKTFTLVSHIEVYDGIYNGSRMSVASRDGLGVDRYPLRTSGLAYVRRPTRELNLDTARRWFPSVQGEGYGWRTLLCFILAVKRGDNKEMICSQFATRWYRKAGFDPVDPLRDADHVAPSAFFDSVGFATVWSDGKPAD